jgi:DNA-binding NarL/FixJ family response regulator
MSIGVFIVDDNFVARRGLRSVLEAENDISVTGEASNGSEAIEKLKNIQTDIVLMDVRMPELDGISATTELLKLNPRLRVLLATVNEDAAVHAQALLAGVSGYLVYGYFTPEELVASVRKVSEGERVIIPEEAPTRVVDSAGETNKLTQRENEVLKLIVTGKDNRQIANELDIEEKTVKNHINNIYSKIGAETRQDAIYYVLRRALGK